MNRLSMVILLSVCLQAQAQRQVPRVDKQVFTAAELAAREKEAAAVDARIEALEQEINKRKAAGKDASALLKEQDALIRQRRLPEPLGSVSIKMVDWLDEHAGDVDRFGRAVSPRRAAEIVDLLFIDSADLYPELEGVENGAGRINYRSQVLLLGTLEEISQNPNVSPETCKAVRDGLVEFYYGTKANCESDELVCPLLMYQLAYCLFRVAEPDDKEAQRIALRLKDDCLAWTKRLGLKEDSEFYSRSLNRLFNTAAKLNATGENLPPALRGEVFSVTFSSGKTAKLSYNDALRRVMFLMRRFPWELSKIREISELGLADYGRPQVNRCMHELMLKAYLHILQAPVEQFGRHRKPIIEYLDKMLLHIGKSDTVLTTGGEWSHWGRAVQSLPQVSPVLKRFIQTTMTEQPQISQSLAAYRCKVCREIWKTIRPPTNERPTSAPSRE